jgi:hypothetical protein
MNIETAMATVNGWLAHLMPDEAPVLDGERQVQVADEEGAGCTIFLTEAGEELVFYVDLMKLVAPMKPLFYEEVLALNTFGSQPVAGSLSFDKAFNTLVYVHRAALEDLSAQKFANTVGNFIDEAARLQEELVRLARENVPDVAPAPASAMALRV